MAPRARYRWVVLADLEEEGLGLGGGGWQRASALSCSSVMHALCAWGRVVQGVLCCAGCAGLFSEELGEQETDRARSERNGGGSESRIAEYSLCPA